MICQRPKFRRLGIALSIMTAFAFIGGASLVWADGKVMPPRLYQGSLEEKAQEAIIIFHSGKTPGEATEDLILKITVEGKAKEFGWVVPLPNPPEVKEESPKLFKELFDYVEYRTRQSKRGSKGSEAKSNEAAGAKSQGVEVISRQVVGSFDVAVVRSKQKGALNQWLKDNEFQTIEDGEDVIEFYRKKGFVFACMKVSDTASQSGVIDVHPLRFSFRTGGRDGLFFPMKMTGLQEKPFDVNLYVFYEKWINDKKSRFGYTHRGFSLRYRDWDTPRCQPNAGKGWSDPKNDPLLASAARLIPTVAKRLGELHPGKRFYLTNIQAFGLKPKDVRTWPGDLWLFPYYTDPNFVPFDVRDGGPSAGEWPGIAMIDQESDTRGVWSFEGFPPWMIWAAVRLVALFACAFGLFIWQRQLRAPKSI